MNRTALVIIAVFALAPAGANATELGNRFRHEARGHVCYGMSMDAVTAVIGPPHSFSENVYGNRVALFYWASKSDRRKHKLWVVFDYSGHVAGWKYRERVNGLVRRDDALWHRCGA